MSSLYKYQVFLSYRRAVRWRPVVNILHDQLRDQLQDMLGAEIAQVRVFKDDQDIPYGAKWPNALADALASSAVLVPILWPDYFNKENEWCRTELSLMSERSKSIEEESGNCPGLIFPIKVYDFSPEAIGDVQTLDVSFVEPMMTPKSPTSQKVWKALKPLVKNISESLHQLPPPDPTWRELAADTLQHLFGASPEQQRELPSLGNRP